AWGWGPGGWVGEGCGEPVALSNSAGPRPRPRAPSPKPLASSLLLPARYVEEPLDGVDLAAIGQEENHMIAALNDRVVMRDVHLVVAHDRADAGPCRQIDLFDALTDDEAFALRAVGDGFERLGSAAPERVDAHDVAAAHVSEQRADRHLLRRERDIDRAAFHELRIRRTIDERHDLVAPQALRQHRREDVRFFGVRHRDEHVGTVDVLFEQQLFVRRIAVEHDRIAQMLRDASRSPRIALDEFYLVHGFESLREPKTDVAAARDHDASHRGFQALHLAHHESNVFGRGDEEDL